MDDSMKEKVKEYLDPRIITTILIVALIEFEVFTVPRGIVEVAGRDAWISVLLGGIILSLTVYFLIVLATRFPRKNFHEYCGVVWGKPLGWAIILSYFLFWSAFVVVLIKEFGWINQILFLPETPMIIILLLIVGAGTILISYGFAAVARFFQLILLFILLPLVGVFLLTIPNMEVNNFFPILEKGFLPVLKGTFHYLSVFQGLMAVILISSPFLKNIRQALKPALLGINIVFFVSILQTVGAIGVLGVENILESAWPGIDTITVIELPGFPVERFELWLTLTWIMGGFTTGVIFHYVLVYGIVQVFGLKSLKQVNYLLIAVLIVVSYLIPNYAWTLELRKWVSFCTIAFVFVIPLLTLILAFLRKKGDQGL